jgi:hypothetical protein
VREGSLGLRVKVVKDDAVGKAGGELAVLGECVEGLGGEGGLANAARSAERDDAAGLEVGQETGEFGVTAGEVLGAWRELEEDGGRGGLLLDELDLGHGPFA